MKNLILRIYNLPSYPLFFFPLFSRAWDVKSNQPNKYIIILCFAASGRRSEKRRGKKTFSKDYLSYVSFRQKSQKRKNFLQIN